MTAVKNFYSHHKKFKNIKETVYDNPKIQKLFLKRESLLGPLSAGKGNRQKVNWKKAGRF
jgi:hypothetical protein